MSNDEFKLHRFCEDCSEYAVAELYWDDLAAEILSQEARPGGWKLLPRPRNVSGQPLTEDGQCTMLSLLHETRKRWVTIEQFAPSTGARGVWAGVEEFGDPHNGPIFERLRIDCVLTDETETVIRQLLVGFVVQSLDEEAMNKLILRLGAARA